MRGHDDSTDLPASEIEGPPLKPTCWTCGSTDLDTMTGDQATCNACGDEFPYHPRWIFPGDRVRRRFDVDLPLTVVRVNPKTITVDTDDGRRLYVPHGEITGFADDDDEDSFQTS